jgi:hypothetical protein
MTSGNGKCEVCWFGPNGEGKADVHACTLSDRQNVGRVCYNGCQKFRLDDYHMKFPSGR